MSGFGAYTAAALYVHFGIGPWIGLLVAVPVAGLAGAFIGFLAFRFRVGGVYFAILTIAFAEFARVGFDHLSWTGGSAGLFLPVAQYTHNNLWLLRGDPAMFYYVLLVATVLGLHRLPHAAAKPHRLFLAGDPRGRGSRALARHRHLPLQDDGGGDLGRHDLLRRRDLSPSITTTCFPSRCSISAQSIEIILGPIVGGVGTLFGPILGAFVLTGLAETLTRAARGHRRRSARRQAGVLRHLPAAGDHGAAGRRLAVAVPRASG